MCCVGLGVPPSSRGPIPTLTMIPPCLTKDTTHAPFPARPAPPATPRPARRCADDLSADGVYNKFRDDVTHEGHKIDWGKWAITSNDPNFKGTGNPDTGG